MIFLIPSAKYMLSKSLLVQTQGLTASELFGNSKQLLKLLFEATLDLNIQRDHLVSGHLPLPFSGDHSFPCSYQSFYKEGSVKSPSFGHLQLAISLQISFLYMLIFDLITSIL